MIRVKDAEKSLKFYQEVLGMTLFRTSEQSAAGFNLYFLGYPGSEGVPENGFTAHKEGLLELTWNYGTEKDENFKYHDGNAEPQGFGHICKSIRPRRLLLPPRVIDGEGSRDSAWRQSSSGRWCWKLMGL
jgi:lactoylglutathione lyase